MVAIALGLSWIELAISQVPVTLVVRMSSLRQDRFCRLWIFPILGLWCSVIRAQSFELTEPSDNSTFVVGTAVIMRAEKPQGVGLAEMKFFANSVLIGTDSSDPYAIKWTPATGEFSIKAVALSTDGASYETPERRVTVKAAPTIVILSPTNNNRIPDGTEVPITVQIVNATVKEVQFYTNNILIGSSSKAPFSFQWTPAGPGAHTLTAKGIQIDETSFSSAPVAIEIFKRVPPEVTIISPLEGFQFTLSRSGQTPLQISAHASDADGQIVKVEFWVDDYFAGTDTLSPYSVTWSASAPGQLTIRAEATDSDGLKTSASIKIVGLNSPPVVQILRPLAGGRYSVGENIFVHLSASDPNDEVIGAKYFVNEVPVNLRFEGVGINTWHEWAPTNGGTFAFRAEVRDRYGATASDSVQILVTSNDDFNDRIKISGLHLFSQADSSGATTESDEVILTGENAARSLWWNWIPEVSAEVEISTFGTALDTLLKVFEGAALSNLSQVVENDDAAAGETASMVRFPAIAGRSYQIWVAGFSGESGSIRLNVRQFVRANEPKFTFKKVVAAGDLISGGTLNTLGVPVLNDAGVVAFYGTPPFEQQQANKWIRIPRGDGASFPPAGDQPLLNDSGFIFYGTECGPFSRCSYLSKIGGGSIEVNSHPNYYYMNNVHLDALGNLFIGVTGAVDRVPSNRDTYFNVVQSNGQVSTTLSYLRHDGVAGGINRGEFAYSIFHREKSRAALIKVNQSDQRIIYASNNGPFDFFAPFGLMDSGEIAFLADSHLLPQTNGIYIGTDKFLRVVLANDSVSRFGKPMGFGVNAKGDMAFLSSAPGGIGIFNGNDYLRNKVINVSDTLDGQQISALNFNKAINFQGQIAFWVQFASGQTAIYLATPQPKSNQTISFESLTNKAFDHAPFSISATASSGLPVKFLISGPATISNNIVTLLGVGLVTIIATQPGNADFNPAPEMIQSFTVRKASQTISFSALPDKVFGDSPFQLIATANSGLSIQFSVIGPASLSNSFLTILGAGTVTITASQPGNSNFNPAAEVGRAFVVGKARQSISFPQIPDRETAQGAFKLAAASSSGLPVGFRLNSGPATLVNSVLTPTNSGTISITATQNGSEDYLPAEPLARTVLIQPSRPFKLNVQLEQDKIVVSWPDIYGPFIQYTETLSTAGWRTLTNHLVVDSSNSSFKVILQTQSDRQLLLRGGPVVTRRCGISAVFSRWIVYTAPASGRLQINTDGSDYDTLLGVYQSDWNSLACDDNSGIDQMDSALVLPVIINQQYFIGVAGVDGASGVLRINQSLTE